MCLLCENTTILISTTFPQNILFYSIFVLQMDALKQSKHEL